MNKNDQHHLELSEHFFRNEYGKMVAVISKYLGTENIETAEDIVQETLLKAVDHWQHHGIPVNPQAWLYTTAKNLTFNQFRRQKHKEKYLLEQDVAKIQELDFSEHTIADEQLRTMLACCQPSISKDTQLTLMLKILCGFSIAEIANAFFTTTETINKRLVRGRKQLRENKEQLAHSKNLDHHLEVVCTAIYLIFNEGYNPTQKSEVIRLDFCIEAIRLAEIIVRHSQVTEKFEIHALLALMCFNASRFRARLNDSNSIIGMEQQDRRLWNQELINKGIHHLSLATQENRVSTYLLMASISANHCIAPSFEETNWKEILYLYDGLLKIDDSPINRLNRCVAMAKVTGNKTAIAELKKLEENSTIQEHYLFHLTLGELYNADNAPEQSIEYLRKALSLVTNKRDEDFIKKKMIEVVPV